MSRWSRSVLARLVVVAGLLIAAAACVTPTTGVTVAAAGDIACSPQDPAFNGGRGTATQCRQRATSDLLLATQPALVLPLGDLQYEAGAAAGFATSYGPTWGRLRNVTRPVPGNHEYRTPGASGYFGYFGGLAGDRATGYYSYDLGGWHLVALNTNCAAVGGCGVGSPQERWLRADLAAHPARCTLLYMHHPRFSSGLHGDVPAVDALWRAAAAAKVDVVLAGHDHHYERFAPMNASGIADADGIRSFVVGTGGKGNYPITNPVRPTSQVRQNGFGVLFLTLKPGGYDWRVRPAAGATSPSDSGSGACH